MAMAVTVPVTNGTVEMDGHRLAVDVPYGIHGSRPIAQMRVTQPPWEDDDGTVYDGVVIELALTSSQIRDIIDMMELYR